MVVHFESKNLVADIEAKVAEFKKEFEVAYRLNQENYERFMSILTTMVEFVKQAKKGRINAVYIKPTKGYAAVIMELNQLAIRDTALSQFSDMVTKCDMFGLEDGSGSVVMFKFEVSDVWTKA